MCRGFADKTENYEIESNVIPNYGKININIWFNYLENSYHKNNSFQAVTGCTNVRLLHISILKEIKALLHKLTEGHSLIIGYQSTLR